MNPLEIATMILTLSWGLPYRTRHSPYWNRCLLLGKELGQEEQSGS